MGGQERDGDRMGGKERVEEGGRERKMDGKGKGREGRERGGRVEFWTLLGPAVN